MIAPGLALAAAQPQTEFTNEKIVELRKKLIDEEFNELKDAINENDLIEVADALTDILVVTYGAGVAFGLSTIFTYSYYGATCARLDRKSVV